MTHHLIVRIPDEEPIQYALNATRIGLGRGQENQIQINQKGVSYSHLEILIDDDECTIRDLGSANGTLINGDLVMGEDKVIQDGDRMLIGEAVVMHYMVLGSIEDDAEEMVVDGNSGKIEDVILLDQKIQNLEKQIEILNRQHAKKLGQFQDLLIASESLKKVISKKLTEKEPSDAKKVLKKAIRKATETLAAQKIFVDREDIVINDETPPPVSDDSEDIEWLRKW